MGFAKPIEQYLFGNQIHVFMYLKDIIRERNAYGMESEFFRNSKEILRKPELTIALRMYYDKRAKVLNFCPFCHRALEKMTMVTYADKDRV